MYSWALSRPSLLNMDPSLTVLFFFCFLFILSSPKGIKVKHSVNESLDVEESEGELCRLVSKVAS